MRLVIKAPKNIFSYTVSQNNGKNSAYTMSLNVFEVTEWKFHYQNIWNKVESQFLEKITAEFIKRERKYMHGSLKTWNKFIKAKFHG